MRIGRKGVLPMSRFTRRSRFIGLAAASVLVLAAAAAPVRAQTPAYPPEPLVDDSLVNGGLIGLGVGFGVGFVTAGFLTSSCDVRHCTPLSGTEFTAVTAAGPGIGRSRGCSSTRPEGSAAGRRSRSGPIPGAGRAAKAAREDGGHPGARAAARPQYFDDSTVNGLVAGTALGTMGGLFVGIGAVDRCGGDLCNRPPLHTYLLYGGVGAGSGAFTGWLIDKLHRAPAAMPDAVAVSAGSEAQAVHMQWRF